MTLITIIGVWALAFGHITLTQDLKLKGNEARLFGALCIAAAAYGMPHLHRLLDPFALKFVESNDAFKASYELLVGAFAAYATAWITTRVIPNLRVPSVKVSFKRHRA